mgnify:CR=1 FL=1
MNARVKAGCRWDRVMACGGVEFTKEDWRPVPADQEEQAQYDANLEIEPAAPVVSIAPEPKAETGSDHSASRKRG